MTAVAVLGPIELRGPGGPVPLGSARQRRLLTALAVYAGEPVTIDRLVDLVWDEAAPGDPAAAVHTLVARLRRALPDGADVETVAGGYRLRTARAAVDAVAFADAVADASASADPAQRAAALAAALRTWRGPPYAELDDPDVVARAARLTELRAEARERHASALLAAGRPGDAVAAAEALCVDDPWRESAVAVLMQALAAAGRRRDALAAYSRLRRRLAEELGVDPGGELRALEARLLRDEVPPPTVAAAPQPPASTFVGRADDLARALDLLGRNRVVTLTGTGGVGKTRLARHVLAAAAPRYDDGVVFVRLAGGGAADVEPAVAAALGLADGGRAGEALTRRIVEVLAVRRVLLVLDNCEHVADEVAVLVEAVCAGGSTADVLLTSREPLRVDGEQVMSLAPLGPAAAAALLVDRIRAGGATDPVDPAVVDALCRGLDGLPLALELAAARVPALGLRGLAVELGLDPPGPDAADSADGSAVLDVLRGGRRTAAPRHRSLRDVVAWSYGLLDAEQRTLFERMSVFAGAVERAAVVAVCGDATALPDLVDRSLVVRLSDEPPRFAMLETLRAFGRERLATGRAAGALRSAHTAWAVATAAEIQAARRGPGEPAAVARFDSHLPDLRRAHARLCELRAVPDLLALGMLFADLGYLRGRADLVRLAQQSLTVADVLGPDGAPAAGPVVADPAAARLLGLVAASCWQGGDLDLCAAYADRAIAMAAAGADPGAARDAHEALANVHSFRGDLPASVRDARRCLELADAADDDASRFDARLDLALAATYAGDDAAAAHEEGELAVLAARLGTPTARAFAAYVVGERLAERDGVAAAAHLRTAISEAESVGSRFVAGLARHTLVTTAVRDGAGTGMLLPLLDHWIDSGAWTHLWVAVRTLVVARSQAGDHAGAATLLGALRTRASATAVFGADARREAEVECAGRAALGPGFDDRLAAGGRLDDAAAIALARRLARGTGSVSSRASDPAPTPGDPVEGGVYPSECDHPVAR